MIKNIEGVSWWCHISHSDVTLNHLKSVLQPTLIWHQISCQDILMIHISRNNWIWSFNKSVTMTKIQEEYLDDALLDHSKRVQEWQEKACETQIKKLGQNSMHLTMFYIQCVTWLQKGDFQTQLKIAVRMVYNITMFHIW